MTDMIKKMIMLLVAGALIFIAGCTLGAGHTETKEVEVPVEKIVETEKVVTNEILEEALRDMSELVTAQYSNTSVETFEKNVKVYGHHVPFSTTSCIYSYDVMVYAGIDFSQTQIKRDEKNKTIQIILPEAEIFSTELLLDSFQLYDEQSSVFNPMSMEDANFSEQDLKNSAIERALSGGILTMAENNAVNMVENFLRNTYSLGDYRIEVVIGNEDT